jgi:hypothetical protein
MASMVTRIEAGIEVPRAMASFLPQPSQVGHPCLPSGLSDGHTGEEKGEGE